jgi:large subunit ribosomal protein L19
MSQEEENKEEKKPENVIDSDISKKSLPDFRVGDTIKVNYKIIEGEKVRTQPYQGIVIAIKGSGVSKTFTVRKIGADGVGVERIFPFHSPNIESVRIMKKGKVRRAKLYYLRDRVGRKATRIKEKV